MFGVPMDDDGPSRSDTMMVGGELRSATMMSRGDTIASRSDSMADPERVSDTPGIELSDLSGQSRYDDHHAALAAVQAEGDTDGSSRMHPPTSTLDGADLLVEHALFDANSFQSSIAVQPLHEGGLAKHS